LFQASENFKSNFLEHSRTQQKNTLFKPSLVPKYAHENNVVNDGPALRRDECFIFVTKSPSMFRTILTILLGKGINFSSGGCLKNFLAVFPEVRSCFQPKQEKHLVVVWLRLASACNVIVVAVEKVEGFLLSLLFVASKQRRLAKVLWKLSICTVLVLVVSNEKLWFG
jgi:hypothetical protein